jgi:Mrp family chromosome partitioning ATPase
VTVSQLDLASSVLNVGGSTQQEDPVRLLATQAQFARLPAIAQGAVRAAGVPSESASDLLAASTVTPSPTDDFLTFTVSDARRDRAARLASAYAGQYVAYLRQYKSAQLAAASRALQGQIQELAREGRQSSPLYANLVGKANQLAAAAAIAGTTGAVVSASQVSQAGSHVLRDVVFALVLALVAGLGLAFLRDALDPRVRSAEEMGSELELRLLGRLPRPSRYLRRADAPVTLAAPDSPYAQPYRMLRTSIEFMIRRGAGERIMVRGGAHGGAGGVSGDELLPDDRYEVVALRSAARGYRLMVTSAVEGEGKSTTVANLGVAFAQVGWNVVLVDLDFRRSSLPRFFGVDPKRGLTDVITGSMPVASAVSVPDIARLPLLELPFGLPTDGQSSDGTGDGSSVSFSRALDEETRRRRGSGASLRLLPFGTPTARTLDATLLTGIKGVLNELRADADLVLIDSPPLLRVGDALALTSHVDGLLVLGSLRTLQTPMLKELRRVLDESPAAKLGFVLTGADFEGGYEYLAYPAAKTG